MDANSFDWVRTALPLLPVLIFLAAAWEIGRIGRRTADIQHQLHLVNKRLDEAEERSLRHEEA